MEQPIQQPTAADRQDIADNKVVAAIGYLFILCLVPLILKPGSKFAQFHGKQGLVLTIASVVLWLAGFILMMIPIIGWLALFVGWISLIVAAIMGIVKALAGEYWEMPALGKYARDIKL